MKREIKSEMVAHEKKINNDMRDAAISSGADRERYLEKLEADLAKWKEFLNKNPDIKIPYTVTSDYYPR